MAKNKGSEELTKKETKIRRDKEASIEAITKFQREFLVTHKRLPTYKQISEGTGYCPATIKRRARDVSFENEAQSHASKLEIYTLLHSLYLNAMKGNIKAFDRYIQFAFGIMPAQDINLNAKLSAGSGFEEKLKEVFEKHGESKIDELFKLLDK